MSAVKVRRRPASVGGEWRTLNLTHAGVRYEVEALVFDAPRVYGIDGGRVSKLWVRADGARSPVYNYDRGLDVDRAAPGLVELALREVTR